MAKKKNKVDAMDTSIDKTDAPEGTAPESNGEEQQQQQPEGTEQQLDADTVPESNGEEQQPAPSSEDKPAESTGEDKAADDLDEDMAAEVAAVKGLYEELTGGSKMPANYNMGKVVRDAWATKKAGKPYPGYGTALRALTGVEVG